MIPNKPSDKSDKPANKSDKPSDKPADKPGKSNGTSIDKPNWMKPEKLAQQGPINKPSPALPYVPKHDHKTLPETGDHASLLASFGVLLLSASLFLLSNDLLIFKKNNA